MTRRSTSTVTVLSILSLVTRPVRTRFGIGAGLLFRGGGLRRRACVNALDRLDAGDLATRLLHPAQPLVLTGGALEAQVELLLAQIEQQRGQFVRGLQAEILRL